MPREELEETGEIRRERINLSAQEVQSSFDEADYEYSDVPREKLDETGEMRKERINLSPQQRRQRKAAARARDNCKDWAVELRKNNRY